MKLGVEVLFDSRWRLLEGRKVGLVSNYTMTDQHLKPIIDLFLESDYCQLVKLYGPEHGVYNSAKEGEHVGFTHDRHSGLPAYSLYGDTKKPNTDMLGGIDVLVIDLQDIGCRYYTNMNTVALCMEACAQEQLPCIVLDRPNPIGARREGYVMNLQYRSFVGMYPIPNRHGLTMGELAQLYRAQMQKLCDLTVVAMEGWKRSSFLRDTDLPFTSPSPNTSGQDMEVLYPGTCLFEGTNVSVARGTIRPFEMIGAPWLNGHELAGQFNRRQLPGVVARPVFFSPHYSLYKGELCEGVQLHVTDLSQVHALQTGIALLQDIALMHQDVFQFKMNETSYPFFDLLAGDNRLRLAIGNGSATNFLQDEEVEHAEFAAFVKPFELYE